MIHINQVADVSGDPAAANYRLSGSYGIETSFGLDSSRNVTKCCSALKPESMTQRRYCLSVKGRSFSAQPLA